MSELYTKKEWQSLLLKTLGRSPKLRIIDLFLENPYFDFTKKEVKEALGMGKRFHKHFEDLEKSVAVKVTKRTGHTMYQLDRKNEVVKHLVKLDMALARKAMERAVEEYRKPVAVRHR